MEYECRKAPLRGVDTRVKEGAAGRAIECRGRSELPGNRLEYIRDVRMYLAPKHDELRLELFGPISEAELGASYPALFRRREPPHIVAFATWFFTLA